MAKNKGGVRVRKPASVWVRPLKTNFKDLFKSLGKAVVHGATLNWVEATKNTVDALSAVGIEQDAGQIAWVLIQRSVIQAMFSLVGENLDLIKTSPSGLWNFREQGELSTNDFDGLCEKLDQTIESSELILSKSFFDHPAELPAIKNIQEPFSQWLVGVGLTKAQSNVIADRLPAYFVYALADEWRTRRETYALLSEAFNTPFTKSGERERAWIYYSAWLRRQVEEPMFSEAFSLKHVYVPIRAYYLQERVIKRSTNPSESLDPAEISTVGEPHGSTTARVHASAEKASGKSEKRSERVVVDLQKALDLWVHENDPQDAIRIISGGPGSGKSSFAKMFAAQQSEKPQRRVLFVPLHRFEPTDDLVEALKEFVELEGMLPHNPLDPQEGDPRLLIIFDGLDELSMQGKVGADIAQRFVQEVQRKVDRFNTRHSRLKVIMTGRDLSVQANASSFRRPQQILHLLPYCLMRPVNQFENLDLLSEIRRSEHRLRYILDMKFEAPGSVVETESGEISFADLEEEAFTFRDADSSGGKGAIYLDKEQLLIVDQRQLWWKAYGEASGRGYEGIPAILNRSELREVTAQPLLNYLVALSFDNGRLDFSEESNINIIYDDLLKSVYQRVWANYQHPAIGDIQQDQYIRILEEIAVAALHGDGRTTTLKQIEKQCDDSGIRPLLEKFKDSAKESVSRLLMAFYFRQSERLAVYDETFEFTHKSFGEYLAARRIRGSLQSITEGLQRRNVLFEGGWNERDALAFWLKLCGPVTIDEYIVKFFENEVHLYDRAVVENWQSTLIYLIGFILNQGMPTDRLEPRPQFREEARQARNAEVALLVAMNVCARYTQKASKITWPTIAAFSEWASKLRGQRISYENDDLLNNYDYLDLSGCALILKDLFGSSLLRVNLEGANLYEANLKAAYLREATLERANLGLANLEGADLIGSTCEGANFTRANIQEADLREANFTQAHFKEATLVRVDGFKAVFNGADLESADLTEAYFDGASFQGATLTDAICIGTQLRGATFKRANLQNVDFQGAYLDLVDFEGAELEGANFRGAYIGRVYLEDSTHTLKNGVMIKRE